jgi:O-antigen/teichoic acid export membrane protein
VTEDSSVRRRLPAGIVDTSFSSLSTFVVGFTAVVRFDDVDRGAYALFFAAYLMGELIANEWVFTPAEVESISVPASKRLSFLPRSLTLGLAPCLIGSLASLVALALALSYTSVPVAVGLTMSSALLTVLSPMQNHVRRMLHIGARSSIAAAMSLVQFVVVLGGVWIGTLVGFPLAWLPFGALAVANAVSIMFGLWLARQELRRDAPRRLGFRQLSLRGVWFVLNGAASAIAGFVVAAAISSLAGPEDLGYAESARIVAQPILVFATGLTAVLGPRVMQAGLERDAGQSRSVNRLYATLLLASGLAYLLAVGWDWGWNPVVDIVPSAYVLTGLVALAVAANAGASTTFLQLHELAGAGRERLLAAIGWFSSVFVVAGGLTAGVTGAYARSIGMIGGSSTRFVSQRRALRSLYGESQDARPGIWPTMRWSG